VNEATLNFILRLLLKTKRMKGVVRIFILLLLPIVIDSMTCCDCAGERIEKNYTYCSNSISHLDNTGVEIKNASVDGVLRTGYTMRITLQGKALEREGDVCHRMCRPIFSTAAYATSCDCGWDTLYSPIVDIVSAKIITVHAFDDAHPAGDDISELFFLFSNDSYKSFAKVFAELHEKKIYRAENLDVEMDFLLMTAPAPNTLCSFKFVIELSDGRMIETTSDPIVFL
jgi:hypothetical protein